MTESAKAGVMTYVLIHGAGDVGWYWHLVERELRARGHEVVVMDLPVSDDSAGKATINGVSIARKEKTIAVGKKLIEWRTTQTVKAIEKSRASMKSAPE